MFLPGDGCTVPQGKTIQELFESFDEVPLASASIAQVRAHSCPTNKRRTLASPALDHHRRARQVHRATLRGSSREVVVKVQHPGVDRRIRADLVPSLPTAASRLSPHAHAYALSVLSVKSLPFVLCARSRSLSLSPPSAPSPSRRRANLSGGTGQTTFSALVVLIARLEPDYDFRPLTEAWCREVPNEVRADRPAAQPRPSQRPPPTPCPTACARLPPALRAPAP